jgi:dnd system-associated protein 4
MAVIRVPKEAQSLLPLCRRHDRTPTEPEAPACFETYADLIVFAASYGFAEMEGRPPKRRSQFLDRPNPIDLAIFKNDGRRYPQILLIALATSRDRDVVRDEETVCHLIEDFASLGCERLAKELNQKIGLSSHLVLSNILANSLCNADELKI